MIMGNDFAGQSTMLPARSARDTTPAADIGRPGSLATPGIKTQAGNRWEIGTKSQGRPAVKTRLPQIQQTAGFFLQGAGLHRFLLDGRTNPLDCRKGAMLGQAGKTRARSTLRDFPKPRGENH